MSNTTTYEYIMRFLVCATICAASLLSGCARQVLVTPSTEKSTWANEVNQIWLPQTQEAVRLFEAFAAEQSLPTLKRPPHFEVLAAKNKPSQADTQFLLHLPSNKSHTVLFDNAVRQPLQRILAQQQTELAQGADNKAPAWLREGSPVLLADMLQARMGTAGARIHTLKSKSDSALRKPENTPDIDRVFAMTDAKDSERKHAFGWLVKQLADTTGERFTKAWRNYFQQTAEAGFTHEHAFKQNFGLTPEAFAGIAKSRLQALQAEKREHATLVPAESGFAKIDDLDAPPFASSNSARKGYQRYLKARAPKAFFTAPHSYSFSDDDPDAINTARKLCEQHDRHNCRLYAVDDKVVFTQPDPASIRVFVQMAGDDTAPRYQEVSRKWKSFIQESADFFLSEISRQTGKSLQSHTTLHVATTPEDFQTTLQTRMRTPETLANQFSLHSAGVANGKGQIAIFINEKIDESMLPEHLTEVVMHELAHELQGQLRHQGKGFAPAPWLVEGSAEVLAVRVASRQAGAKGQAFDRKNRETQLKHLYRLEAMPAPAEIFNADTTQWRSFSGKGKQHYPAAELMTHFLATRLEERFDTALIDYFQRSGTPGEKESSAFQSSFGLSKDEFLSAYQSWLQIL